MAPPKSLRKNSIPRIIAPSKAHIAMITIWVELRRLSAMVFSAATLLKRHYPYWREMLHNRIHYASQILTTGISGFASA
jgi:hypothetical protein